MTGHKIQFFFFVRKNSREEKSAELKEFLMCVRPENASKDAGFHFCEKKTQFEEAGTLSKLGFTISQKPFLEAFYEYKAAYRTAKQKKPHIIGETLVKPCVLEMVELVCRLEQKKNWKRFPCQMM
jgi:hypothetical protein